MTVGTFQPLVIKGERLRRFSHGIKYMILWTGLTVDQSQQCGRKRGNLGLCKYKVYDNMMMETYTLYLELICPNSAKKRLRELSNCWKE
jgi:hypothetical protein